MAVTVVSADWVEHEFPTAVGWTFDDSGHLRINGQRDTLAIFHESAWKSISRPETTSK